MNSSASTRTGSTCCKPVNCLASNIGKQEDVVEFRASCRIKDYIADERERVLVKVEDP
jgi:hypothetical protein